MKAAFWGDFLGYRSYLELYAYDLMMASVEKGMSLI